MDKIELSQQVYAMTGDEVINSLSTKLDGLTPEEVQKRRYIVEGPIRPEPPPGWGKLPLCST